MFTLCLCVDVDECTKYECNNGGTCKNKEGGWNCSCPEGFQEHWWNATSITCEGKVWFVDIIF